MSALLQTLLSLFGLLMIGLAAAYWRGDGLDPAKRRQAINAMVYWLFLPALVLSVIWTAPLGLASIKIALSAAAGVLGCLALAAFVYRLLPIHRRAAGALVLAAGFPNATYMGLPLLQSLFGENGRATTLQYDLYACTPLVFSVGMWLAARYGGGPRPRALRQLLKVPPLWAALLGLMLNIYEVPAHPSLMGLLELLGQPVIPLMLLSAGMALAPGLKHLWRSPSLIPALAIQLLAMPALVWWVASGLNLQGEVFAGVVLEAALPSMAMGIVISDRFKLDTERYAATLTASTLLSALTLPMWVKLLGV